MNKPPAVLRATLRAPYRDLADPRAFESFLNEAGALANRHARKLDFKRHFRALVLLHTTHYTSAWDLTWAVEEDLLFEVL